MNGARTLLPAAARVKRVVRRAVDLLGGVDGAAATADRGRSTAGRWRNLNDAELPCLDSALAMDEVLVAAGHGPLLLQAMAGELGHVVLDVCSGEPSGELGELTAENARTFGEFMAELLSAQADGKFSGEERSLATAVLDDMVRGLLRTRAAIVEGAE